MIFVWGNKLDLRGWNVIKLKSDDKLEIEFWKSE